MFCLTCFRVSSPGATYCAYCPGPRSFNAPLCSNGHRCPTDAALQACPTCGSVDFSEFTRGLPTGWLAKLVTVLLLIALWNVGLAHIGNVLGVIGSVAAYAFGVVTNTNATTLGFLLRTGSFYAVMAWVLGWWLQFMPGGGGAIGKFLRGIPGFALRTLLRGMPRLARFVGTGILRLAGFHTGKSSPPVAKSKARSDKGDDLR